MLSSVFCVLMEDASGEYEFTNRWFDLNERVWDDLISRLNPSRVLEVGSFEGRSTCYLIDRIAAKKSLAIHCVDTWEGGIEHRSGGGAESDMGAVELRFLRNTELAISGAARSVDLVVHKAKSEDALARLIAAGEDEFDFIYIDGSHQAPDVLTDAILCFQLLKVGGVMVFDDYIWYEGLPGGVDPLRCPKIAIDSFTTIFSRKLRIVPAASVYQIYVEKTSY